MKRKIAAALALLFVISGTALFAQSQSACTIQCNIIGAKVFINGDLLGYTAPNFSILLAPGTYILRVTKEGYTDYNATFEVRSSPVQIPVRLGQGSVQPIPTPIPTPLPPSPPTTIYNPTAEVRIDVPGVQGAAIYRDGAYLGTAPYVGQWALGTYTLRIMAPGYADYSDTIYLYRRYSASVAMTPLFVDYEIRLDDSFFGKNNWNQGWGNTITALYLDNQPLSSPTGRTTPGVHTLTLVVGRMNFDVKITLKAGQKNSIEPFFGAKVY